MMSFLKIQILFDVTIDTHKKYFKKNYFVKKIQFNLFEFSNISH